MGNELEASQIQSRLERLADAFERHGIAVRGSLLPGASDAELDVVEAELGVVLPQAYRALYTWSAGCSDPEGEAPFLFRDNAFLELNEVVQRRQELVEAYQEQTYPGDVGAFGMNGVDLTTTAPFAETEGAVYVVACGPHTLASASQNPVISVFEGIDVYFNSIESMLDTCIEWVEQEGYDRYSLAPDEKGPWLRHNPGVFGWSDS